MHAPEPYLDADLAVAHDLIEQIRLGTIVTAAPALLASHVPFLIDRARGPLGVVPQLRAVWLPGGTDHEILCRGPVSFRTLYVEPDAHPALPGRCRVIKVSDLLRALILEAIRMPIEYDRAGRDGRVMVVTVPLHVPMPQDNRLVRICKLMQQDPADSRDLDDWAREARMARRTLTRLFRDETGMSFAAWRQQTRLLEALARLAIGQPITAVALDVGYNSPSAFTAMFRRIFGTTSSQYLD